MDTLEIEKFIKKLKWKIHAKMYGCHHCSTIGFITSEWLKRSVHNEVFDGAPKIDAKKGRHHADLLMRQDGKYMVVGEVESDVSNYKDKTRTILDYLGAGQYGSLKFGILVMMNCHNDGKKVFDHLWEKKNPAEWDRLVEIIKKGVGKTKKAFAIVSIKRGKERDELLKKNQYYSGNAVSIDYRIFDKKQPLKGNLWRIEKHC